MTSSVSQPSPEQPTQNARNLSARLRAVQAVYQSLHDGQDLSEIAKEYADHRMSMTSDGTPDGIELVEADRALFSKITRGAGERLDDIKGVIRAAQGHAEDEEAKTFESLLLAILICGTYELMAHVEVDSPILINDYLNVTHGFYEQGEAKLVNGLLDKIASGVRD